MKISTATLYGSLLLAAAAPGFAGNVDQKLLDVLLQNGSINQQQHTDLSADLKREERADKREMKQYAKEKDIVEINQFAGWAKATKLIGDVRVRHEAIDIEGESSTTGRDRDRERIRARLGAVTQVNPEVETGIQIASGGGADRRSTNQDMDGYFDKKSLWLDLAYIDYHPVAVPGLKVFAGKMKQPWMAVGDLAWDGDINPEGFATNYTRKNGTTTYFGSAGYFVLKDNVDGDGVEFEQDLAVYTAQGGIAFDATDSLRLTLGASVNQFNNEAQSLVAGSLAGNGNTTDKFGLYELFSQVDVIGLPLPLSLYGQYIQNADARDFFDPVAKKQYFGGSEDTAWLVGVRTNVAGVALDYNYRDVDANAVVGTLTDSDFASGFTNSSGHKFKAQYDLMKNFNVGLTYFLAESDVASRSTLDATVDTLQLDVNAKF
jgi:polyhydroxyalkanoate synthesis regulator phasin